MCLTDLILGQSARRCIVWCPIAVACKLTLRPSHSWCVVILLSIMNFTHRDNICANVCVQIQYLFRTPTAHKLPRAPHPRHPHTNANIEQRNYSLTNSYLKMRSSLTVTILYKCVPYRRRLERIFIAAYTYTLHAIGAHRGSGSH